MTKKPGKRGKWPRKPKKKVASLKNLTAAEKRRVLRLVEHMRGHADYEAARKRKRRKRKWPVKP